MSVSTPQYIYPPIDADSGALYQGFVTFMQANIPGWQPYSAELDDWLGRVFVGIQASLTELTSDVATSIFRWFGANIVSVPPLDATAATGLITITVQDTAGYTVPAFTQVSFSDGSGNLQGFETTTDTVIAPSSSSATNVFVQAMTPGSAGNNCSGTGDLDGSAPITFITGLDMTTASSGGTDAENDADYLNRLAATFTTLTPSPITTTDFTVLAEGQPLVDRAVTLMTFNPNAWTISGTLVNTNKSVTVSTTANIPVGATVTGTGVPSSTYITGITSPTVFTMSNAATTSAAETLTITGQLNQPSWVTTFVMGATGVLSSGQMTAIQAVIVALCLGGVNFVVEAPTVNTIAVSLTGICQIGTVVADVEAAVQAAITNFLQPDNFGQNSNPVVGQSVPGWLNDNQVRLAVMENIAMNVPGMKDVTAVTINTVAANFALLGIVPITTPGTISVTLTNG